MSASSRLRILDYLRKHQTATVGELGQAFTLTGADIRHHLSELKMDDMVEIIGQRQEGRGRPVHLYGLSRRLGGDHLEGLAEAMLQAWLRQALAEERQAWLESLAQRLAGESIPGTSAPLLKRLNILVEHLNERHYQARWEAGGSGPLLVFGHCPYRQIAVEYPELCQVDGYMLEKRLNLPVRQVARLERNASGLTQCIFELET